MRFSALSATSSNAQRGLIMYICHVYHLPTHHVPSAGCSYFSFLSKEQFGGVFPSSLRYSSRNLWRATPQVNMTGSGGVTPHGPLVPRYETRAAVRAAHALFFFSRRCLKRGHGAGYAPPRADTSDTCLSLAQTARLQSGEKGRRGAFARFALTPTRARGRR